MTKPVILTGLRANNDLHIGNYFGALLPLVDMARQKAGDYQINLFVPDLHSFTTPIDHGQLQSQIMHNLKLYAAAGLPLDHADVYVYRQSYIPAHSELTWILDCFTGMGEMGRMTQFKDKSGKLHDQADAAIPDASQPDELAGQTENASNRISVGLFNYPVLMAADILLYDAGYVPVGEDQTQHLEFARDIAERLNRRFGQLFVVPKPVREQHAFFGQAGAGRSDSRQGLRIRDLQDPGKKMSKSDESAKGVIFLGDDPAAAAKKIMSAATDSAGAVHLDYDAQPGISNLLQILALLSQRPLADVADEWDGRGQYGALKQVVAAAVQGFLADFQARLAEVDERALSAKLQRDEALLNERARATLLRVQKAVGLR